MKHGLQTLKDTRLFYFAVYNDAVLNVMLEDPSTIISFSLKILIALRS